MRLDIDMRQIGVTSLGMIRMLDRQHRHCRLVPRRRRSRSGASGHCAEQAGPCAGQHAPALVAYRASSLRVAFPVCGHPRADRVLRGSSTYSAPSGVQGVTVPRQAAQRKGRSAHGDAEHLVLRCRWARDQSGSESGSRACHKHPRPCAEQGPRPIRKRSDQHRTEPCKTDAVRGTKGQPGHRQGVVRGGSRD
jgi:hypothetical protein